MSESEFDRLKAQKELIVLANTASVRDEWCAEYVKARESLAAMMIRVGFATGHGDTFDALLGEAQSQIESLRFDLLGARNEIEMADGEIERQKAMDPLTPTEKRIEFLKLLKIVQKDGEKPGDTILRALGQLNALGQSPPR